MSRLHFVYHLKLEGMALTEGYIGISVDPINRFRRHKRRKDNPHLLNAFKKYGNKIKMQILSVHNTEEDARWEEYVLRPFKDLGWNIAQGGTKSPILAIGGHSPETIAKIAKSNTGKKASAEARQNISNGQRGKKLCKEHVELMRKMFSGHGSAKSKPANIYCYKTDELVASNVVVRQWAKQNNVSHGPLFASAKADRSKPSSKTNVCHSRGFYIRYL